MACESFVLLLLLFLINSNVESHFLDEKFDVNIPRPNFVWELGSVQ